MILHDLNLLKSKHQVKFALKLYPYLLFWSHFLNPDQIAKKIRKGKDEKCKAITFNKFFFSGLIKINKKIPINGIKAV